MQRSCTRIENKRLDRLYRRLPAARARRFRLCASIRLSRLLALDHRRTRRCAVERRRPSSLGNSVHSFYYVFCCLLSIAC
jgi:hypothetical protein